MAVELVGIGRQKDSQDVGNLLNTYEAFSVQEVLKNGHILHKFIAFKKDYNLTAAFIKEVLHDVDINYFKLKLRKLFVSFGKKKGKPTIYWTHIVNLLNSPFIIPHIKVTETNVETNVDLLKEHEQTEVFIAEDEIKFKNDCGNCKRLRETNSKMALRHKETISALKKEILKLKSENMEVLKKYTPKKIKQSLNRKISKITELKSKLKSFSNKINYNNQSKTSKKDLSSITKIGIENVALKLKVTQLESEAIELNDENELLVQTKTNRIYEFPMRKALYKCLVNHVPISAAGQVIKYVIKSLTGKEITNIPTISTIAQMAYELGVLADIQAAEFLLFFKNATLSWDATTLKGSHVNQIHISNIGTSLTLSLKKLPGGKAIDYADHTCQVLNSIATSYALLNNVPVRDIEEKIFGNISNTLTDRAPVNHAVVEKLNEAFSANLLEMNCNLHPLDSLATVARQTLSNLDKIYSVGTSTDTYRTEGRAALCIYSISKLRYKQGSGDPSNFKGFLRSKNLPLGIIVRYVGNRLHVLFHLAATIIIHLDDLRFYVQNVCVLKGGVKKNLQHYLWDPVLIMQLKALAFFGKFLTGPWMTLFYSNKHSNLEMAPHIQKSIRNLDYLIKNPQNLVKVESNIFGEQIDAASLIPFDCDDAQLKIREELAKAFHKKLTQQLKDFLEGGKLHNPSREMLLQTASAPAHNIWAERSLGMTDHLFLRSPNATFGFLDGKIRAKTNKTIEWLEEQQIKGDDMVKFVIKRAGQLKKEELLRSKRVEEEIIFRQQAAVKKRDEAHRKKIDKDVKSALYSKGQISAEVLIDIPPQIKIKLDAIIEDKTSVVGAYIKHIWENDKKDQVYFGRILKIKEKGGIFLFTIRYWDPDSETEAAGEDYDIAIEKILTDLILGDLLFL